MPNTSEILVDTLIDWDVSVVFGLPGDGINGVMEALRQRQDKIRFVQVRHEASAAFMASGYAKWTGKLGVCFATSGPGGTNLLTGLYDAKLDQLPVLAITGMQSHALIETFTQQDVDLVKLFDDVSVYNARVSNAEHMEEISGLACRSALARRGVAHLSIPNDVQEKPASSGTIRNKQNRRLFSNQLSCHCVPKDEDIRAAADILNRASRVAILAGRGSLGADEELVAVSERLGAPIAKALLGKGTLPDDHPNTTGGIGLLGTAPSQEMMEQCDALLIVGSTFPYLDYYPDGHKVKGVQIDIDPQRIGLRFPVDAALVGDAKSILERLNDHLERKSDQSFLENIQKSMSRWREDMIKLEKDSSSPLKPQPVVHAFGRRMADNGVLATDSGQNTELTARHIPLGKDHDFTVSGTLAAMASAVPYLVAAGMAFPERPLYGVVGDGGLSMQLGEFATAVHHKLPLKLLVIRNGMLNQIAWEQMMFLGNPRFACELPPIDFAQVAKAMGAKGFTISRFEDIETVLEQAFAENGPVLIEAIVDPDEPMVPPKMPDQYAENFKEALPETKGSDAIVTNARRAPHNTDLT